MMTMRNGMKNSIKKHLIVSKTLHEETINGIFYKVIENKCFLPAYKDRRALAFYSKQDNKVYMQSMIYLSRKYHQQPCMITPQRIIEIWGRHSQLSSSLVLGCAGCAIPRFTALEFPSCKTKGIEHSPEIIEIAKKFFLLDEIKDKFEIIQDDAFEYVKKDSDSYDVIFVDLFDTERLPQSVYSQDFVNDLFKLGKDKSIIIFNMLNEEKEKIVSFAQGIKADLYKKILVYDIERKNLILIKNNNSSNVDEIIKEIEENWEYVEV